MRCLKMRFKNKHFVNKIKRLFIAIEMDYLINTVHVSRADTRVIPLLGEMSQSDKRVAVVLRTPLQLYLKGWRCRKRLPPSVISQSEMPPPPKQSVGGGFKKADLMKKVSLCFIYLSAFRSRRCMNCQARTHVLSRRNLPSKSPNSCSARQRCPRL